MVGATLIFTEAECTWEGAIRLPDDPDDGNGTFDCPRCRIEGLLVDDHLINPIRDTAIPNSRR
jgi:hypothetical protein